MLGISLSNSEFHFWQIYWIALQGMAVRLFGFTLWGSPRNKSFWDPVLDRCIKRLASWKANYLSLEAELH